MYICVYSCVCMCARCMWYCCTQYTIYTENYSLVRHVYSTSAYVYIHVYMSVVCMHTCVCVCDVPVCSYVLSCKIQVHVHM